MTEQLERMQTNLAAEIFLGGIVLRTEKNKGGYEERFWATYRSLYIICELKTTNLATNSKRTCTNISTWQLFIN